MKQTDFFNFIPKVTFGGETLKGRRKTQRPLSKKAPMHLILRAKESTLRRHEREIQKEFRRFAEKFGLRVYELAVCTNHIHSVVRIHSRRLYNQFVQAFAGTVSRKFEVNWLVRPFTRLLNWGKDYLQTCNYVIQNELEASGVIPYQARKQTRGRPVKE